MIPHDNYICCRIYQVQIGAGGTCTAMAEGCLKSWEESAAGRRRCGHFMEVVDTWKKGTDRLSKDSGVYYQENAGCHDSTLQASVAAKER